MQNKIFRGVYIERSECAEMTKSADDSLKLMILVRHLVLNFAIFMIENLEIFLVPACPDWGFNEYNERPNCVPVCRLKHENNEAFAELYD